MPRVTVPDLFPAALRKPVMRLLKTLLPLAVIMAICAVLPLLAYYLHVSDTSQVIEWYKKYPGPYKLNVMVILLLFLLFYALFNSVSYGTAGVTVLCLTFGIADMQKMRILQQPLIPGDLYFIKQALFVARLYAGGVLIGLILLATVIVSAFVMRRTLPHLSMPWKVRIPVIAAFALLILLGKGHSRGIIRLLNKRYSVSDVFWDQATNYRRNGVLYAFLLNTEGLKIHRPPNYGRQAIDRVFAPRTAAQAEKSPVTDSVRPAGPGPGKVETDTSQFQKPHVIICMSESFWDVTQLATIPFPCDPVPHFRSIVRTGVSTELYTPVFGGNTCDAEFEILTGMSNGYFPRGSRAYNQLIQRPIPSLVRVFKESGYRTSAIHTYKKWFWNRLNVYRHLGFDDFISLESMDNPVIKGKFVGDDELACRIIRHITADTLPHFIFALSMQNHGPYNEHRYSELECRVVTGFSPSGNRELNMYVQGLIDADRSLRTLTTYIDMASRPTLLFFFGDHLPGFTHVYREAGYEERVKEKSRWAYTTRGVWYANFPLLAQEQPAVSMLYVPLLISRQARLPTPPYYRFLGELMSRSPSFTGRSRTDTASALLPSAVDPGTHEIFWTLIYDALFGKGFAAKYHRVYGEWCR